MKLRSLHHRLFGRIQYHLDFVPEIDPSCIPEPDVLLQGFAPPYSSHLIGWAFHSRSSLRLYLYVNELKACEVPRNLKRRDVQRAFHSCKDSLLSGFAIRFPKEFLRGLGGHQLSLVAETGTKRHVLWKTEVPLMETKHETTEEALRLCRENLSQLVPSHDWPKLDWHCTEPVTPESSTGSSVQSTHSRIKKSKSPLRAPNWRRFLPRLPSSNGQVLKALQSEENVALVYLPPQSTSHKGHSQLDLECRRLLTVLRESTDTTVVVDPYERLDDFLDEEMELFTSVEDLESHLRKLSETRPASVNNRWIFSFASSEVNHVFTIAYLCNFQVALHKSFLELKLEETNSIAQTRTWSHSCLATPFSLDPPVPRGKFFDDLGKSREALEKALLAQRNGVSIIIPIYNALDASLSAIRSVLRQAGKNTEIILVNDCSDSETSKRLESLAQAFSSVKLVTHEKNLGFVESCISGYEKADPHNDILLLNSDVVLPAEGLKRLREAAYSRSKLAAVSPLSTASPHLEIDLPPGTDLESANRELRRVHTAVFPSTITPEGQCLYIRRWALQRFGFLDRAYGRGYGEESDLLIRMFLHGADIACADNLIVFHRKSASFSKDEVRRLKRKNRATFLSRWNPYYEACFHRYRNSSSLDSLKETFSLRDDPSGDLESCEVVFVIPCVGVGGGNISVYQHVNELIQRGVRAQIVALEGSGSASYPLLCRPMVVSASQLENLPWSNQAIVCTFWSTAPLVTRVNQKFPDTSGYYYIQGYEPWFYPSSQEKMVDKVTRTYSLPLTPVVKTEYLAALLKQEHDVDAKRVCPGLARDVFYPGTQEDTDSSLHFTALYRDESTWRGGDALLALLYNLLEHFPTLEISLFGDTHLLNERIPGRLSLLGRIKPNEVAKLYRQSHVTADLSRIHGFGRVGLEAMACGCAPVLIQTGGCSEYAVHNENCLIVPPDNSRQLFDAVAQLLGDVDLQSRLRQGGLHTAQKFSEYRATQDWCEILGREMRQEDPFNHWLKHEFQNPQKERAELRLA